MIGALERQAQWKTKGWRSFNAVKRPATPPEPEERFSKRPKRPTKQKIFFNLELTTILTSLWVILFLLVTTTIDKEN